MKKVEKEDSKGQKNGAVANILLPVLSSIPIWYKARVTNLDIAARVAKI